MHWVLSRCSASADLDLGVLFQFLCHLSTPTGKTAPSQLSTHAVTQQLKSVATCLVPRLG